MSTAIQTSSMTKFAVALVPAMTPERLERLQACFDDLVSMQDQQIELGEQVSCLPLAWVALAEWVGLIVDIQTGRIIGGPCSEVRGL